MWLIRPRFCDKYHMHTLHYSLPYPWWKPEPSANEALLMMLYINTSFPLVTLVEREKVRESQKWKHTHILREIEKLRHSKVI